MKTSTIKFYELCDDIDFWKSEAAHYKKLYEEQAAKHDTLLKSSISHSSHMAGQMLKLCLSADPKKLEKAFK